MNELTAILIVAISGLVGATLDIGFKVKDPCLYWIMGSFTGAIATLALIN